MDSVLLSRLLLCGSTGPVFSAAGHANRGKKNVLASHNYEYEHFLCKTLGGTVVR